MTKEWTPARLHSFIVSALRSAFGRFPAKYECKKTAFTEKKINPKTGRLASFYRCAACQMEFTSTQVEVDHKDPIVPPKVGFTTWDDFIKRLYCEPANLQLLCTTCHKKKSQQERKERLASKNSN